MATKLTKVTVFADADGNTYSKATATQAANDESVVRGEIGETKGFFLRRDCGPIVADAVAKAFPDYARPAANAE